MLFSESDFILLELDAYFVNSHTCQGSEVADGPEAKSKFTANNIFTHTQTCFIKEIEFYRQTCSELLPVPIIFFLIENNWGPVIAWLDSLAEEKEQRGDEETAKGVFLPFSQPAGKVSHNCSPLGQLILHLWDIIILSRAKAKSTGIAADRLSLLKEWHLSGSNSAPN